MVHHGPPQAAERSTESGEGASERSSWRKLHLNRVLKITNIISLAKNALVCVCMCARARVCTCTWVVRKRMVQPEMRKELDSENIMTFVQESMPGSVG